MNNALLSGSPSEKAVFDRIRIVNVFGGECWSSRQLASVLGYDDYRNFESVVMKAKIACLNSGNKVDDHFGEFTEMVTVGSATKRPIKTFMLSRYACYLAIQNADPKKPYVAFGQTYFAEQTRRQELNQQDTESEQRVMLRGEVRKHNKNLVQTAKSAGVVNYPEFQNHGYRGLYGGMAAAEIHRQKGLLSGQSILDHMGSTELAANLFRATQTEQKLRRDAVHGENQANAIHLEVGTAVRKTIEDLGGTMPEKLPVAEDIKIIERKKKKASPTKELPFQE